MAKAKQLKSGRWRVQYYKGKKLDGKPDYGSATFETEIEANIFALQHKKHHKEVSHNPANMTLTEAIDRYIESNDAILSPSTIREYRQEQRNWLQGIMNTKLNRLTQEMIQKVINHESRTHAPKTVRNMHGLLSTVLREYYPEFRLNTKLPPKDKREIVIPEIDTVMRIIGAAKGTYLEAPVLLAVCLGLRRSEILGLKWDCIDLKNKMIKIKKAKVLGEDNKMIEKNPKSYAGNRGINIPNILVTALKKHPKDGEYLINITGCAMYKRFSSLLKKHDIPHIRFHDLRHINASVMLKLNVPNKYAAERMGHSTEDMLKSVYQHTLLNEKKKIDTKVNAYLDRKFK